MQIRNTLENIICNSCKWWTPWKYYVNTMYILLKTYRKEEKESIWGELVINTVLCNMDQYYINTGAGPFSDSCSPQSRHPALGPLRQPSGLLWHGRPPTHPAPSSTFLFWAFCQDISRNFYLKSSFGATEYYSCFMIPCFGLNSFCFIPFMNGKVAWSIKRSIASHFPWRTSPCSSQASFLWKLCEASCNFWHRWQQHTPSASSQPSWGGSCSARLVRARTGQRPGCPGPLSPCLPTSGRPSLPCSWCQRNFS